MAYRPPPTTNQLGPPLGAAVLPAEPATTTLNLPPSAPHSAPPPVQTLDLQTSTVLKGHKKIKVVPEEKRLVEDLSNKAWGVMLRRFNKQTHHVHIVPTQHPRISSLPPLLDLQPSPDEHFSPDKLRSNVERLYASVVIKTINFVKEMMRLRSWSKKERKRTGLFLAGYILAWLLNLVTASLLTFLSVLILFPRTRPFFFPPLVIPVTQSPVDPTVLVKGTPQPSNPLDPTPSVPGAVDILPEEEANREVGVERMAGDFADGIEAVMGAAVANHGVGDEDEVDDEPEDEINEERGKKAERKQKKNEKKEAKKSTSQKLLDQHGRPVMLIIGDLTDSCERWSNAISPTKPFGDAGRRRLVMTLFVPMIIATSGIFSEYFCSRVVGAGVGFLFFGQPVLDQGISFLDAHFPHWIERIQIRNTILAGVPTNAQISLRLLRDAELRLQPLPPPPPPPEEPAEPEDQDDSQEDVVSDMEVGEEQVIDGASSDAVSIKSVASSTREREKTDGHSRGKLAKLIKGATMFTEKSAAILSGQKKIDWEEKTKNTLDKMHIAQSNPVAKTILRAVPDSPIDDQNTPSIFFCYRGQKPGHIIIQPPNFQTKTPARIVFTTVKKGENESYTPQHPDAPENAGDPDEWTISINDLAGIKKTGMGFIGRTLTSVATGMEGAGGTGLQLKIRGKPKMVSVPVVSVPDGSTRVEGRIEQHEEEVEETTLDFGKIPRRDELFNRLIALGEQRWELL